jgi:hypothetical protein
MKNESWFYDRSRWYARWGRDPVEHFLMKLEPEPNTGCWLWTGGVDKDGYGKFQLFILPERKQVHMRAHRFSYALEHGVLPSQMLLHSCDTPACCNPYHTREGTQAENIAEKVARGRHARGSRVGTSSITDEAAARVVELLRSGKRPVAVIRETGVSRSIVHGIASGRSWKHLGEASP